MVEIWRVRGGGRIISDRARLAECSRQCFTPLPLYTHAPYTRFSPLPRPQFVCINAQPRDRSTPPGNEEAEKPGKFHSAGKRRVPRREGRANFRDTAISTRVFPSPSPGFYGRHDCPQRREGRRGDFQAAGKSYPRERC